MNPNQNSQTQSKSIFVSTIELIGSIILIMLFATILYGIFTSSVGLMLWKLFDWIVEIMKPIVAIAITLLLVFKGPTWVESIINAVIEDMRSERESINIWEKFESSPTPVKEELKTATQVLPSQELSQSDKRGGGEVSVHIPMINGGRYLYVTHGSKEHIDALQLQESETKRLKEEFNEQANENLKGLKSKLMASKKEFIKEEC